MFCQQVAAFMNHFSQFFRKHCSDFVQDSHILSPKFYIMQITHLYKLIKPSFTVVEFCALYLYLFNYFLEGYNQTMQMLKVSNLKYFNMKISTTQISANSQNQQC